MVWYGLFMDIRCSVQEFMNFSAATIAERTPAGQRQSVESESKWTILKRFRHVPTTLG